MDLDANQLLKMARDDRSATGVHLVEIYYDRIYAFLRRLAGNDTDAEDLTQRTFSRALDALPTYAGRSSVASWIHGIAHHTFVDWVRASRRMESRPDEWWAGCASTESSPDEAVSRSDSARVLYACVDVLSPELRETVHLHYYQGLTLQETADAMGIAASTVKYRLRLALDKLRKQISTDRTASPHHT